MNVLDYINGLGDTAANILNAANKPKPQAAAPAAKSPSWLPWAIGGGALLLIGVLFFGMSRK